jgi:DNA (cytosine-5)-methyltransferase 1
MRVFIDLFCGAGGLTEGFKRAGWTPLCGVDHDNNSAMIYLANHGDTAKCVVGSIEDDQIKNKLLESYGRRLTAVVGGPPCQGFSSANQKKSDSDPRRNLPDRFIEVAAALNPEWIVMEEVSSAKPIVEGWLASLALKGYTGTWAVLKAELYGVPQMRRRMFIVARRGSVGPTVLPPPPTHDRPITAGEALQNIQGGGRVLREGPLLHKVKERAELSIEDNRKLNYRPRNAYCLLDLSRPAPTIKTMFGHPNAGAFCLRSATGEYKCLSVMQGAALHAFEASYIFSGSQTDREKQVGNSVPPSLALAVARCCV